MLFVTMAWMIVLMSCAQNHDEETDEQKGIRQQFLKPIHMFPLPFAVRLCQPLNVPYYTTVFQFGNKLSFNFFRRKYKPAQAHLRWFFFTTPARTGLFVEILA